MENEKIKLAKPVPRKKFAFFGGIFCCLLSVCLIINIGVIAKVLTYLPNYLFGCGAFTIYILIYGIGLLLLFKEKAFKVKINVIIGGLLMFVALLVGFTLGFNPKANGITGDEFNVNLLANFKHLFKNIEGSYVRNKQVNVFTECCKMLDNLGGETDYIIHFGGGLVGNALTNFLLKSFIGQPGVWTLAVIVFLIGLVVAIFTPMKKLILKKVYKNIKRTSSNINGVNPNQLNNNPNDDKEIPVQARKPQLNLGYQYNPMEGAGTFRPASFDDDFASAEPIQAAPIKENIEPVKETSNFFSQVSTFDEEDFSAPKEIIPEPISRPTQQFEQPIVKEEEHVQGDIFEESKVEINQELVFKKPELEERKVINPGVSVAYQQPAQRVVVETNNIEEKETQPVSKPKKPVKWMPPSVDLLEEVETSHAIQENSNVAEERTKVIDQLFMDFGIGAHVQDYTIGPSVTRFNIKCDPNVSITSITKKVDDISIRLNGLACRLATIVEGQDTSGLEVPNAIITPVSFKEVFQELPNPKDAPLEVPFGKNIKGDTIHANFAEFPHILVAGTTGSGKSVYVHSIIASLIMRNSPDKLKLFIVDPKGNEMGVYEDIPHLLVPIVSEAHQAKMVLSKLVDEMNDRYRIFKTAEYASDLKAYNEYARKHGLEELPYIICIIDEFADLVENCKDFSSPVLSIGQKARAAGIHMLIATQRPSTNIITGSIKSNLPTHVALTTSSYIDSMTIIGEGGAEKLMGKGDMLVQSPLVSKQGAVRLQSCFIKKSELAHVCNYLKNTYETMYDERFMPKDEAAQEAGRQAVAMGEIAAESNPAEEAKYQAIKEWVMSQQFISMSRIQGECSVGFNRARRIFTRLQQEGVVSQELVGGRGFPVLTSEGHCEIDTDSIPVSSDSSHIG